MSTNYSMQEELEDLKRRVSLLERRSLPPLGPNPTLPLKLTEGLCAFCGRERDWQSCPRIAALLKGELNG